MFGLSRDIKSRMAFYKSKTPTHGKTLKEVVKNYSNPDYASRGPCPSFKSIEAMQNRGPVIGYYGFPVPHSNLRDFNSRGYRASSFGEIYGLRVCCAGADSGGEYSRRDVIGYYADNFQSETIVPLVFRLVHSRGFLIGHYLTDNGEVYVSVEDGIFEDMRAAFNSSHSRAERMADENIEAQAKDQAEMQVSELHSDIRDRGRYILKLIREYKSFPMREKLEEMPAIKEALKDAICSALAERRKAFKRIEELEDNYWLSVE